MRMMTVVVMSVMVAAAGAGRAAAGGAAPAEPTMDSLLKEQVRAIGAGDARAFAATFDSNGYVILPVAAGEGSGRAAIEAAAKTWLTGLGKVTAKLEQPRCSDGSEDGMGSQAWCMATIVVTNGGTTTRLRYTAMFSEEDDPDASAKPLTTQVAHISEAVDDKLALAAAAAGTLPALPRMATGSGDRELGDDDGPDKVAGWAANVGTAPAVALVGSAPGELAVGKAAVVKALKAWKSLKLARTEGFDRSMRMRDLNNFVVAHVVGTYMVKGKPVKVPYRVLFVFGSPYAAAEASPWFEVAHFSVATH